VWCFLTATLLATNWGLVEWGECDDEVQRGRHAEDEGLEVRWKLRGMGRWGLVSHKCSAEPASRHDARCWAGRPGGPREGQKVRREEEEGGPPVAGDGGGGREQDGMG
jgi:hypothetical protein